MELEGTQSGDWTAVDLPSPEEVADLLRSCEFALSHGQSAMVAFVDRKHVGAISRDFDRMGEVIRQVKAMLDRLPPEPPMSPERMQVVGRVVAAALNKRLGDGTQQDVDEAMDAWLAHDEPPAAARGGES